MKTINENLNVVIKSCEEGIDGTWDCSTDEGKEGFEAMIELLERVKKEVREIKTLLNDTDTVLHLISISGNHFKLTPQIEKAINEVWPKIGKILEKPYSKG